jgi:hypothetical protein
MQARLDRMPDAMGVRRQTVEHPFGTIKAWMGSPHFLTRTLKRVSTEMRLHVLAYNIKRVIGDHRCRTAATSDPGLSAWISSQTLPQSDCGGRPGVLCKCVSPRPPSFFALPPSHLQRLFIVA